MNRSTFLRAMSLAALSTLTFSSTAAAAEKSTNTCYELRTYFAAEGKLDALHSRFRDHTLKLLEKHGITSVGYWTPIENTDNKLIFLLSYPDKAAHEKRWAEFQGDPDWQAAKAASEANGKLVVKVENRFLTPTDFSTVTFTEKGTPHTFELRTYTTGPENLTPLLKRFREHTIGLFTKHGIEHFHYFTPSTGQTGSENTLIYFLVHASPEAQAASFKDFRADPEWIAVKDASEKLAGGSLTIPDGVKSETLIATDYSPVK